MLSGSGKVAGLTGETGLTGLIMTSGVFSISVVTISAGIGESPGFGRLEPLPDLEGRSLGLTNVISSGDGLEGRSGLGASGSEASGVSVVVTMTGTGCVSTGVAGTVASRSRSKRPGRFGLEPGVLSPSGLDGRSGLGASGSVASGVSVVVTMTGAGCGSWATSGSRSERLVVDQF